MSTPTPVEREEDASHAADMPTKFKARITGEVHHRVGDGPLELIPLGEEVNVDVALASMVVSWTSDGQPVTVTVAREEFLEYVDTGAIQVHS